MTGNRNARCRSRSSAVRTRAVSPDVLAMIVALGATGAPQKAIAAAAGVSQAHVSRVLAEHRGAACSR
jgi:predicted transcriptional regulator